MAVGSPLRSLKESQITASTLRFRVADRKRPVATFPVTMKFFLLITILVVGLLCVQAQYGRGYGRGGGYGRGYGGGFGRGYGGGFGRGYGGGYGGGRGYGRG
ncbi:hypothetical protein MRX96_009593 [Rhipicephalus microplus]